MGNSADFRNRAEECRRSAAEAKDAYHSKNWTMLADYWAHFAEVMERREAHTKTVALRIVEQAARQTGMERIAS